MIREKLLNITVTGILLVSALTGCVAGTNESPAATTTQAVSTETETDTADTSQSSVENEGSAAGQERKVLVVYYSATGTTAAVANSLAELTAGDVFELEPAEPYSSEDLDWRDNDSRVTQEYQNPDSRDIALVADTMDNWDDYDTVYIGYPIWWGIAAWPVNGFVEANDFTGKTVIPFCTSSSSGFGESGKLLEELAATGTWLEGERFRSSTTTEDLQTWTEGLNIE